MRYILFILVFLYCDAVLGEEQDSWPYSLFDPSTLHHDTLSKDANKTHERLYKNGCLYLKGIAMISSKNWTLWMAGKKLTSNATDPLLSVTHITSSNVSFRWEYQDHLHHFNLKIDESYNALTKKLSKGSCQ